MLRDRANVLVSWNMIGIFQLGTRTSGLYMLCVLRARCKSVRRFCNALLIKKVFFVFSRRRRATSPDPSPDRFVQTAERVRRIREAVLEVECLQHVDHEVRAGTVDGGRFRDRRWRRLLLRHRRRRDRRRRLRKSRRSIRAAFYTSAPPDQHSKFQIPAPRDLTHSKFQIPNSKFTRCPIPPSRFRRSAAAWLSPRRPSARSPPRCSRNRTAG